MQSAIVGVGTACPPLYVSKEDAYEYMTNAFSMSEKERDLYERVLLNGPVRGRHIAMDEYADALKTTPDELLERFHRFGVDAACTAARTAVEDAGIDLGEVRAVVVNTCTGYLCPGFTSYVVEELGLPPGTKVFDVMGMGCGGAVPNLECAAGLIANGLEGCVLSIAVEICTATLYMGEDPGLVVSNSIFADGAAAAVLCNTERVPAAKSALRLLEFQTEIAPKYRDDLRFESVEGRLRNRLTRNVPVIGGRIVKQVTDRLLDRQGLDQTDIEFWAVHPGGTSVLDSVEKALEFEDQLRFSREIFEEYGNMSSPTVLFVLDRILKQMQPRKGARGVLLGFGAGFTGFGALVEVV